MSQTSASCSLLGAAHDTHGTLPAVHTGDAVIDFERFYESVEWMAEQLASCGIGAGTRVGLAIHTGWEFVIAWHSLFESDAVTVPIDLGRRGEQIDRGVVDFVLAHIEQCTEIEELLEAVAVQSQPRPVYRVADDFVLGALGASEPMRNEAGLVADPEAGSLDASRELVVEAEWLAEADGLRRGARVLLEGDLGTRDTMVRILACASAGACVAVDAPFGVPGWGAPVAW